MSGLRFRQWLFPYERRLPSSKWYQLICEPQKSVPRCAPAISGSGQAQGGRRMARSEAVRSGGRTILGAGANGCAASCALRLLQLAEHLFRPREIKGWQMDDVAVARALHVLSIVLWIGGVGFVTTVLLPGVRRLEARHTNGSDSLMPSSGSSLGKRESGRCWWGLRASTCSVGSISGIDSGMLLIGGCTR